MKLEGKLISKSGHIINLRDICLSITPRFQKIWTIKPKYAKYGWIHIHPTEETHDLERIHIKTYFDGTAKISNLSDLKGEFQFEAEFKIEKQTVKTKIDIYKICEQTIKFSSQE